MGALMDTGYLWPLIKVTEIVCGVLLILGMFVPLALVVLAPVVLNILLFHSLPGTLRAWSSASSCWCWASMLPTSIGRVSAACCSARA